MTMSLKSTPWSAMLLAGAALMTLGCVSWAAENAAPEGGSKAVTMPPVDGRYTIRRGVMSLGSADFALVDLGANCYRYSYAAKPSGLARMFIGEITEISEFCMDGQALKPRMFSFTRADKSEENYVLHFDHETGVARTDTGEEVSFEHPVYDRLSLQMAVQLWVIANQGKVSDAIYAVAQLEPDETKIYQFRVTGRETLRLRSGATETVRVERVDPSSRSIRVWVDPADGYRIVQVEHLRKRSVQFQMQRD